MVFQIITEQEYVSHLESWFLSMYKVISEGPDTVTKQSPNPLET